MIEERCTNLAMITVNQQWIIRIIENNLHDRMHDGLGDLDLFRPFHFNDKVYMQSVTLVWQQIETRTSLIENSRRILLLCMNDVRCSGNGSFLTRVLHSIRI
jgi:hypothetical protein